MEVEVALLGSLSLIVCMVSVDVKQYLKKPMLFREPVWPSSKVLGL